MNDAYFVMDVNVLAGETSVIEFTVSALVRCIWRREMLARAPPSSQREEIDVLLRIDAVSAQTRKDTVLSSVDGSSLSFHDHAHGGSIWRIQGHWVAGGKGCKQGFRTKLKF